MATYVVGQTLDADDLNNFTPTTITIGDDTNLYRGAANVLRTDDDFQVMGGISVPRGILKYGRRDSVSSNATSSTAVGVLRLDSISEVSGRAYVINVSCHPNSSVITDNLRIEVRGSTSGNATTSSSVLASGQFFKIASTGATTWRFVRIPGSTATLSILLCVARDTGTGNCTLFADGTRNTEMWSEDMGVATDTGVDV